MKFQDARNIVGDTPYLSADEGQELYNHILKTHPANCLELGHAHGVSTIYIAAAHEETGQGCLDTVDLQSSLEREPNLETLLEGTSLVHIVNIHREWKQINVRAKTIPVGMRRTELITRTSFLVPRTSIVTGRLCSGV